VVSELARLPATLVEVQRPPAAIVILTYGLLLLAAWLVIWRRGATPDAQAPAARARARIRRRRPRARAVGALLAAAATAGLWSGWLALSAAKNEQDYAIHVLSVGSGNAVLVAAPGGHAMVCDAGTMFNFDAGETVVGVLHALGIRRLDAISLSHANFDHYSGAATILGSFADTRLIVSPYFEAAAADSPAVGRFLQSLPGPAAMRTRRRAGERFTLGGAAVEVLWPPAGLDATTWQVNDRSLVLRIRAGGRRVLLPGDIERAAIRALLARHDAGEIDLSADVLLAPHHGSVLSGDTTALLAAVAPSVIVVSTGAERPKLAAAAREALGDRARVLSTHASGMVTVRITGDGRVRVETPLAR